MITVRLLFLCGTVVFLASCNAVPPHSQSNLCTVFDQHPEWYDAAIRSEETWGTPPYILMAFVKQESSYIHNARPPRNWFLFIPLARASSARGYAQAKDEAWADYQDENGGLFKSRSDIEDALDFIGWYNHKSAVGLGISKWDPLQLYLAYHEGRTGYARGSYKNQPDVVQIAERVDRQAREYAAQLQECEERFRCRRRLFFSFFCKYYY